MWLSRAFKSTGIQSFAAEKGTVAIGGSSTLKTSSTMQSANVQSYAPYGYSAFAPAGEEILIINGAEGGVGAGTKMSDDTLAEGEISIKSRGGAVIRLKKDGTVEINGFVFTRDGAIKNPKGETVA